MKETSLEHPNGTLGSIVGRDTQLLERVVTSNDRCFSGQT